MDAERKPKKLGDILIEQGIITQYELEKTLELQKEAKRPLGELLVQMGYCTWDDIVKVLAEQYEVHACIGEVKVNEEFYKNFPKDILNELRIVPIDEKDGKIFLGIDNVYDIPVIKRRLKFRMGKDVDFCLMPPNLFETMYNNVIHELSLIHI